MGMWDTWQVASGVGPRQHTVRLSLSVPPLPPACAPWEGVGPESALVARPARKPCPPPSSPPPTQF